MESRMRAGELPRGLWIVVEQRAFNELALLSAHDNLEAAEIARKKAAQRKQCYCMFLKPMPSRSRADAGTHVKARASTDRGGAAVDKVGSYGEGFVTVTAAE